MSLIINLRHLENKDLELEGELPSNELDLEKVDELIRAPHPLQYELEAQRLDGNLLVHGNMSLTLECECARCLKSFQRELNFENWAVNLALEGEEKVEAISDCVDLTPYIREDILLAFPQHPLCETECGGLKNQSQTGAKGSKSTDQTEETSSAWAELNKLKL
jgi:uncharacterized metal-binding protein YceD (DUF177 family)